jgi:hypothetical protein
MNGHIKAQGMADSLGKQMKPRPDVRAEGAYSEIRMVRVAVSEIDGSEVYGKANLVMGKDGKPEKLEIRGCLLPWVTCSSHSPGARPICLRLRRMATTLR